MSPTQGQADIKRATFAPAISKHLTAFLYGWLPLSNAYGIFYCKTRTNLIAWRRLFRCNTTHIYHLTAFPYIAKQNMLNVHRHFFHCNTTQDLSPFRGSVNGCVLSRGSVLRTSPPACILSCLWHYFRVFRNLEWWRLQPVNQWHTQIWHLLYASITGLFEFNNANLSNLFDDKCTSYQ